MDVKLFEHKFFDDLSERARSNPRRRQHSNIHVDYSEHCQRLFNAIEPDSYIRPHRHASDPRSELLVAICGAMAVVIFDNEGCIERIAKLATEKFAEGSCFAVEVSPMEWHTVIALQKGSILLEVKAGPFNPASPKDFATWAPVENTADAHGYLQGLFVHAESLELT